MGPKGKTKTQVGMACPAIPYESLHLRTQGGDHDPIRLASQQYMDEMKASIAQVWNKDTVLHWHRYGLVNGKIVDIDQRVVSVEARKRYFIEKRPSVAWEKMDDDVDIEMQKCIEQRQFYSEEHELNHDECWLHPQPRLHEHRTMMRSYHWISEDGAPCKLSVHLGLAALLIANREDADAYPLPSQQLQGYIGNSWQLSHLCGNWTCMNPRHFTLESGPLNVTRNKCFKQKHGCAHNPKCMKHLKKPLDGLKPAFIKMEELDEDEAEPVDASDEDEAEGECSSDETTEEEDDSPPLKKKKRVDAP